MHGEFHEDFAARALPYCNCKVSGQQPFPSGSDPNETEKLLMRASGPQARSPDDLMISLIICSSRAGRVCLMAAIFARVVGNSRRSEFRCGQFHYWFIVRRRRRAGVRVCRRRWLLLPSFFCCDIFPPPLWSNPPDKRCALVLHTS